MRAPRSFHFAAFALLHCAEAKPPTAATTLGVPSAPAPSANAPAPSANAAAPASKRPGESAAPAPLLVELKASGAFTASVNGRVLGAGTSASEVKNIVPRCAPQQKAIMRLNNESQYKEIVATLDALHEVGCSEVYFATSD